MAAEVKLDKTGDMISDEAETTDSTM